jgi:SPP1 family predicted phage head-tail adaptor
LSGRVSRISAGNLRERLTIQINSPTRAGAGWDDNWTDFATVYAEVLPINGGEAFGRGIERQTQFYRITIRWRANITPQHRLVWRGQLLNIRTCADPDNRRQALLITAESGVPT